MPSKHGTEWSIGKFAYIDALRGYAVLLVMTGHVGGSFPNLPSILVVLTSFGYSGVQLFFVVSCYTLLGSWEVRKSRDQARTLDFFIRRFFRIVPMYSLAAAFYFRFSPPPPGTFSWTSLVTTLTFTNGWSPSLLGTAAESWVVVPGGWSITTEFSFYLLFPFLASRFTTLRSAAALFLASLPLALVAARVATEAYLATYGAVATSQFVYYFLPNQLPVFALGFVAFRAMRPIQALPQRPRSLTWVEAHSGLVVLGLCALAACSVLRHVPRTVSLDWPFLPKHVLSGLIFVALLCTLAITPRTFLVNRLIVSLGRVSFSAYLIHFAVIASLLRVTMLFDADAPRLQAMAEFLGLWVSVVFVTLLVSQLTFRLVELPMIALGAHVCTALDKRFNSRRRMVAIAQSET